MTEFKINDTVIGGDNPCYIIAELSANHNQDFEIAIKSIRAIKDTGANAVKIQSYTPDSLTLDSELSWFKTREDSPWAGQKMYDVYKRGQTPWEWHELLQAEATNLGLDFFSSPFDLNFVFRLENINVPAYKVASLEITDIPLIRTIAKTGKPIIISTGAASREDIIRALNTCKEEGNDQIALLKCTSAYPTPYDQVNLSLMKRFEDDFNCVIGLSDHTLGTMVPIAAVALGASIVEKHFILDKDMDALDKDFSLDPNEFRKLVLDIRNTESALGKGSYELQDRIANAHKYTRSLFVVRDIKRGEPLSESNIKSLRPGLGLHPRYMPEIIGKRVLKDLETGHPLRLEDIESF